MDGLFNVKHGITIRGKDYGFVGISNEEIDLRVDDMLSFVELSKGTAGGTFGEEMEACIDFSDQVLTIDKFTEFEREFRKKFPTYDGHLYLHDLNHFTSDESKVLDSYVNFDGLDTGLLDEIEDEYKNKDDDFSSEG